jgi:hypothetical protein
MTEVPTADHMQIVGLDSIVCNGSMINEWWIGKYIYRREQSWPNLRYCTIPEFAWRDWGKPQKKPESGQLVCELRFEPGTSEMWRSANNLTAMFSSLWCFVLSLFVSASFVYHLKYSYFYLPGFSVSNLSLICSFTPS